MKKNLSYFGLAIVIVVPMYMVVDIAITNHQRKEVYKLQEDYYLDAQQVLEEEKEFYDYLQEKYVDF